MSLLERSTLPVRPVRKAGESFPGYVYRLYNANGHTVPGEVHSCFSQIYSNAEQDRRVSAAGQLAAIAGEMRDTDWPQWRSWHGWRKQSYSGFRFCPACLEEGDTHHALWELPLVKACPVHQVTLLEKCECGRQLTWRWIAQDWRCRCGKPFASFSPMLAEEGLVFLARLIASCFAVPCRDKEAEDWKIPIEFRGLSLDHLYAEIEFLYQIQNKLHRQLCGRDISRLPSGPVGVLLAEWPCNFEAYLEFWVERFFEKSRDSVIVKMRGDTASVKFRQSFLGRSREWPTPIVAKKQLNVFVRRIHVPLQWPGLFLIRPVIAAGLDYMWLRSFFEQTERQSLLFANGSGKAEPKDPRPATAMKEVVNLFISCAIRGNTSTLMRRVALTWPALPEFAGESPLELLAHLISPLSGASYTHLCYLKETLAIVAKEGL